MFEVAVWKNALEWCTSYTSQLQSLRPDYLQGIGRLSYSNGFAHTSPKLHKTRGCSFAFRCPRFRRQGLHGEREGCLFIAILWFTGVSIKPACWVRSFMVRVVFWGFQVLPCLVCHFEKSHKFCFVLFCFKQRNFRICGEAGENTASWKKKKKTTGRKHFLGAFSRK